MQDDELLFDQFWEASTIDRFSVRRFAEQLNAYDSDTKELMLAYPEKAQPLPLPRTSLNALAKSRRSQRDFSDKPLSRKELGCVLASFYAWNGLEHRSYPSAGATYATEVYCTAFNVAGLTGTSFYYDPEVHGIVVLDGAAPNWGTAKATLNMKVSGMPQLLVTFVLFPERATAKYGERGGRFAIMEAGAAMQQLALQIAASRKLKGVAIGGMFDAEWLRILGLQRTNARIALGYLVGK